MSEIKKISDHSYAAFLDDGRVYTLSTMGRDSLESILWARPEQDWETGPTTVGDFRIVPYGYDNNLPVQLRDLLDGNNLAPGVLERQLGLIYGQGAHLFRTVYSGGDISREWVEDAEIESWLQSWDCESFIKGCLTDYLYLKGFFHAQYLDRGKRVGKEPRIARLEHIPARNARLEWPESRDVKDVKRILVGNWDRRCCDTGVRAYPVLLPWDLGKYPAAAAYNRSYSFGRDFYPVPQYWGTLRWINRGSEIPDIFKYVTDNGLNLAYHVHSPEEYWERKREILKEQHQDWNFGDIEKEIGRLTTEFLQKLTEVLSGKENAGKFIHTVDVKGDDGKTVTWSIEPIDQKIKDFVDSQLKISDASVSAITSGLGLHPSLSNIMVNGKLASGSELLYAFKLFLLSDTEIPSSMVLGPINRAIAFNFPSSGLRLGFYHMKAQTEESTATSDRIKNT